MPLDVAMASSCVGNRWLFTFLFHVKKANSLSLNLLQVTFAHVPVFCVFVFGWNHHLTQLVAGFTRVDRTDCPQLISLCLNLLENVQGRVRFLLDSICCNYLSSVLINQMQRVT